MALDQNQYEQDVHISSMYGGIHDADFNTCSFINDFPASIGHSRLETIKLKYASAPNLFDNIYAGNKILYYTVNAGAVQQLVVPNGYYTLDELVAYLNSTATASLTFSATVDNYVNIANGHASNTVEILGVTSVVASSPSALASLNESIGVGRVDLNLAALSNATVSYLPALFGPQNVFINCSVLAHQHSLHHASRTRSVVGCIPLNDTVYGNVAHVTFPQSSTHTMRLKTDSNPTSVEIELRDQLDQLLSLPPNMHPHIVFTVSEQRL